MEQQESSMEERNRRMDLESRQHDEVIQARLHSQLTSGFRNEVRGWTRISKNESRGGKGRGAHLSPVCPQRFVGLAQVVPRDPLADVVRDVYVDVVAQNLDPARHVDTSETRILAPRWIVRSACTALLSGENLANAAYVHPSRSWHVP